MLQCQCPRPQQDFNLCRNGYYRWAINAFTYLHNVTMKGGQPVPEFDEPAISVGWPKDIAPHRVGIVGESLFVHMQVRPGVRAAHSYC